MASSPGRWEVPADELRWHCGTGCFPFESTAEVPPLGEIVGQTRALRAIRMALEIPSRGYNIFICGMPGTGRTTASMLLLREVGSRQDPPPDICYVHSFRDPGSPRALVLPAGRGVRLRREMEELLSYLRRLIPLVLEGEGHLGRRKALLDRLQGRLREVTQGFEGKVRDAGFQLISVQEGMYSHPEVAPVVNGQPVPVEDLSRLADQIPEGEAKLEEIRKRHAELVEELSEILRERNHIERETQFEMRRLDEEAVRPAIDIAVQEMSDRYESTAVAEYLQEVREFLLSDLDKLRKTEEDGEEEKAARPPAARRPDPFRLYRVNVVVDNSRSRGAPVIQEPNPTFTNLFGVVERPVGGAESGMEEFVSIRAGSLLRANGGYLVLDAHDLMADPAVWPALKRALRNRVAEIQNAEAGYMLTPSAIKPEPVKIKLKVVLIGDLDLYYFLYTQDEDFRKIFKVRADFDSEMDLNEENLRRYGSFVSKICQEETLPAFDNTGVAAVVEHGVLLAGRRGKLSVNFSEVADLVREASYWASRNGGGRVHRGEVEEALRERMMRSNLLEEKAREMVKDGLILISTEGMEVGQVNGLTVVEMGNISFGRPVRITAATAVGRAGLINIERESYLSGKTHDKGVLILAGYLRSKYAQDKPLTVSASLCFEQSYSGVDGDSASSAEAYAILSSLAELPLRQGVAVTGSVNQRGDIQAVGGINEKIESFFDLCALRDLSGEQGVVIPEANRSGLMLRPDVVEAVRAGTFHIWAVRTIDEGMEILSGVPAGERLPLTPPEEPPGPLYPPETVNGKVDERLRQLAADLKYYGEGAEEEDGGDAGGRRYEDEEESGEELRRAGIRPRKPGVAPPGAARPARPARRPWKGMADRWKPRW